jgi:hypothetical protein
LSTPASPPSRIRAFEPSPSTVIGRCSSFQSPRQNVDQIFEICGAGTEYLCRSTGPEPGDARQRRIFRQFRRAQAAAGRSGGEGRARA